MTATLVKARVSILIMLIIVVMNTQSYASYDATSCQEAMDKLAANELISGRGMNADGSINYGAGDNITRAEMAMLLARLMSGGEKNIPAASDTYKDTESVKWASSAIALCATNGVMGGVGDNRFAPTESITGYQALAACIRAAGLDPVRGSGWQLQAVMVASENGVDVQSLDLSAPLTRGDCAVILTALLGF